MTAASSGSRMLPTDRIAYSAITERPALKLPGGARMAVWVIINVEEWDPKDTMPRTVITRRPAARRRPTFRTGAGMSMAIASVSGGC